MHFCALPPERWKTKGLISEPMQTIDFLWMGLAALAAGLVNALAGGGTLVTFPVLLALGIPPVAANVTNTVALLPGYLGGTAAQWPEIRKQSRRLWLLLPVSVLGGLIGGTLLLGSGEKVFRQLVPFLILLASALLALQDVLRGWLASRSGGRGIPLAWSILPMGLAAVYGGYFGAGLSVIILAVLGLTIDESMTRLNALKQALAFAINIAAATFFIFSGQVVWVAVCVMAICALLGGWLGGKFANRIRPIVLRWVVVILGLVIGLVYLWRG